VNGANVPKSAEMVVDNASGNATTPRKNATWFKMKTVSSQHANNLAERMRHFWIVAPRVNRFVVPKRTKCVSKCALPDAFATKVSFEMPLERV